MAFLTMLLLLSSRCSTMLSTLPLSLLCLCFTFTLLSPKLYYFLFFFSPSLLIFLSPQCKAAMETQSHVNAVKDWEQSISRKLVALIGQQSVIFWTAGVFLSYKLTVSRGLWPNEIKVKIKGGWFLNWKTFGPQNSWKINLPFPDEQ